MAELFERERFRSVIVGAIRTRPFFVAITLDGGDVDQRSAREVFANLREQPAALVVHDRLVVENHESDIWLNRHFATPALVGSAMNQLPGPLDDSEDEG